MAKEIPSITESEPVQVRIYGDVYSLKPGEDLPFHVQHRLASSRPESDLFGPLSRLIILTFFGGANLFQWFPSFFASKPPEALWRRHQYASSTLHLN